MSVSEPVSFASSASRGLQTAVVVVVVSAAAVNSIQEIRSEDKTIAGQCVVAAAAVGEGDQCTPVKN